MDPLSARNYREPDYNPFAKPSPNESIVTVDDEEDPFMMDEEYSDPFTVNEDNKVNEVNKSDKFSIVRQELDKTKQTAINNIEKVVQRDEELDRLLERSDGLVHSSFNFKKSAKKLKYNLWCDNLQKKTCFIMVILSIIAIIIIVIVEATKKN
jgi:hypothetical protein